MVDGISTSGITKVSGITDLDPARNYFIIDSDERDLTGRVAFTDLINLVLRHVASRLNESGIIPHIETGVSLDDVRRALLDDNGDYILDSDGALITDSSS